MPTIKYGDPHTATGHAFVKPIHDTTATALPLPIVTEAEIGNAASALNTHRLSGKQEGAMVLLKKADEKLYIAVATGSEPSSPWALSSLEAVEIEPVDH